MRGDLLVGADGLRSATRRQLIGEREARFTGVVVWRGLIPREKVPARYDAKIMSWYGPRRHVLLYPLRHDRHPESVYSLSAFVPATEVHRESWTASGDLADLRASLAGACPALHDLLAVMDGALITGIYFRDPLETWGSDRVVLLGDAAHPAPPSAGQGAGMALEDAVMLAACLQRAGAGNERAALREYAFRRKAAHRPDARVLPGQPAQQPDQRPGPGPGAQRLPSRARAAQPGRPADAGMAARARPGRRRAAVGGGVRAEPGRARQPDAPAGGAAGLRPVARRADRRAPGGGLARRARKATPSSCGTGCTRRPGAGRPPRSAATARPRCWSGARRGPLPRTRGHRWCCTCTAAATRMGSAELSVPLAGRLAEAAGGWALVPDYRLAPEHPFPAALDDVLAAYRWLARQYPLAPVIVSGECAGGGLALSLALALRDCGGWRRARGREGERRWPATRMPAGIHVVSPFCDLALSADQLGPAADSDPWLNRIALIQLAACYIQDTDPGHAAGVTGARGPVRPATAAHPGGRARGAVPGRAAAGRPGPRRWRPGHVQPGRRQRPLLHPVRLPAGNRPCAGGVRRVHPVVGAAGVPPFGLITAMVSGVPAAEK